MCSGFYITRKCAVSNVGDCMVTGNFAVRFETDCTVNGQGSLSYKAD